jgi:hypothetical protein
MGREISISMVHWKTGRKETSTVHDFLERYVQTDASTFQRLHLENGAKLKDAAGVSNGTVETPPPEEMEGPGTASQQ